MLKSFFVDLLPTTATRWALTLFIVAVCSYLYVRYLPPTYMTRLVPIPTPEYVERDAGTYILGSNPHSLTTYLYALVVPFGTQGALLPAWPQLVFGAGWLVALSLLVACISFSTDKIRLYILLGALVGLSVLLMPDAVAGPGMQGWALRGLVLLAQVGLPYFFSQWRPWLGLGIRFGAIAVLNAAWFIYLGYTPLGDTAYALWASYAALPMLLVALLWVFQLAYIAPYWGLRGAVLQSVNPAIVFGLAMLLWGGNILIAYIQSKGLYTGALYVPDTAWIVLILAIAGVGPYQNFVATDSNWFNVPEQARTLWLAWAAMGFCFLGLAQSTENASLYEVIEDTSNLSIIGVAIGYLFYVYVNFGTPLWRGMRADRVFFDPRQLLSLPLWQ